MSNIIKLDGLDRLMKQLDPKLVKKAAVRSLNRTAPQAFTAGSKEVRKEYNVKAKDINKAKQIQKANFSNLYAVIKIVGARFKVLSFAAREVKKGVTVKIKKSGGRKLIPGAFKASMRYGPGIFKRHGKARGPVQELKTISIPVVFHTKKVMAAIQKTVAERISHNFNEAYKFYIGRVRK